MKKELIDEKITSVIGYSHCRGGEAEDLVPASPDTKEFKSLSEKRGMVAGMITSDGLSMGEKWSYPEDDVKEFIRRLKEEHRNNDKFDRDFQEIIDKLAGDKLI